MHDLQSAAMASPQPERPEWHMRRSFLVAFLLTALVLSLFKWWAGPLFVGYLAARYAFAKLTFAIWP